MRIGTFERNIQIDFMAKNFRRFGPFKHIHDWDHYYIFGFYFFCVSLFILKEPKE